MLSKSSGSVASKADGKPRAGILTIYMNINIIIHMALVINIPISRNPDVVAVIP